jgi:hypothetical protein
MVLLKIVSKDVFNSLTSLEFLQFLIMVFKNNFSSKEDINKLINDYVFILYSKHYEEITNQ